MQSIFEKKLQENSDLPLRISLPLSLSSTTLKRRKRKEKGKKGGKFASFFSPLDDPAGKTIVYSLSNTFPQAHPSSRVSVGRNSYKSRPRFPLQGHRRASLCRDHSRATILLSRRSNGRTSRRNKSGAVQQQVHNFANVASSKIDTPFNLAERNRDGVFCRHPHLLLPLSYS